ncbi:MAG: succinate dehydrogenase, hydrophobic membrane anchor protein [Methylotenera sp.]|nr:succinate dehydrogenase, hydrophobic membrane anchor protein [Methylotenera sp.]
MLFELLTKKYPGMRWWLTQRMTAVFMAVYLVLALIFVVLKSPNDFVHWQQFWQLLWWQLLTFTFFTCLIIHAWLGIRDVMRDYVFNVTLREWLQLVVELVLMAYLVWLGIILWG